MVVDSQRGADDKFLQINTSIPQPQYVRNTLLFFPNTIPDVDIECFGGRCLINIEKTLDYKINLVKQMHLVFFIRHHIYIFLRSVSRISYTSIVIDSE